MMAIQTRVAMDASLVTFHLLNHWWIDKQCDPPYLLFGGELLFTEFAAAAGLILERYESAGRCWSELVAEYTDRLIAIVEKEARRPKGQEMHDLAKQVVEKFKEQE